MPLNCHVPQPLICSRPLSGMNAVMRDLDRNSAQVRELIDDGRLIAFNIAAKNSTQTSIRVLTASIDKFRQTGQPLKLSWPEVFALIFCGNDLFIRGVELTRYLNCERQHVQQLIASAEFKVVKTGGQGRGNSPIITRDSFESFLEGRRL